MYTVDYESTSLHLAHDDDDHTLSMGAMGAIAPMAKKLWRRCPQVAPMGILLCRRCTQPKCTVKITNVSL